MACSHEVFNVSAGGSISSRSHNLMALSLLLYHYDGNFGLELYALVEYSKNVSSVFFLLVSAASVTSRKARAT